jgi:hypothetical protein
MSQKRCNRCGETKPEAGFYKRKSASDGLNPWCIDCYRRWHRDRYKPKGSDDPRACEWCAKEYTPKQRSLAQRFCSSNCKMRARYWRDNPREARSCDFCKTDITHMRKDARFCSGTCAGRYRGRNLTPERRRAYRLWSKYRITVDDYEALLAKQGEVCAICGTSNPKTSHGFWHVDHCHRSGKVRGLLCGTCNTGLGSFYDRTSVLRRAAAYLEATASD